MHAIFQSQVAETRSHVLMGKFQTERFTQKNVDADSPNDCASERWNHTSGPELRVSSDRSQSR